MFEVYEKRCHECLFSNNKIVSEKRKQQLLASILKEDKYFICHKSSIEGGATCCRGFYDAHGNDVRTVRMAKHLNVVEFVPMKEEKEHE